MYPILEIKNFGPIEYANIVIKPITVIIGEQAAGKSTIAKLIAISNFPKLGNLQNYGLSNYWHTESSHINYSADHGFCTITDTLGQAAIISSAKTNRKQLESIYIPTERILVSMLANSALELMNNSITLPKSITQFGTLYQKAKQELSTGIDIDFLNITYENKDGSDIIKNNEKELNLQESASGYQSVLPLYLVMKYYSQLSGNKTFVVEEPELNLYPKTQYNLVNFLVECANQKDKNLVITTHSPYILTSLNNLLMAGSMGNKKHDNEVKKIVNKNYWINPKLFAAYHVENGKVINIFDEETGLISETELDTASDFINDDFDNLMEIYHSL